MATAQAAAEQARLLSLFALLPDGPAVFHEWQRLVVTHDVKGRNAHDARLVAAMTVHGLHRLLTFNAGDFARFPGLTVLAPEAFLPTVSP
jgi:predicted nucleic acid-binding protein